MEREGNDRREIEIYDISGRKRATAFSVSEAVALMEFVGHEARAVCCGLTFGRLKYSRGTGEQVPSEWHGLIEHRLSVHDDACDMREIDEFAKALAAPIEAAETVEPTDEDLDAIEDEEEEIEEAS